MRRRNLRSIVGPALATAAVAVLAACGGGSSSSSAKETATSTASTVKATRGGNFCKQIAATYNEALSISGAAAASPDALRQELDKALADSQATIDNAPAEVMGDLQVIHDAVTQFADKLAKVGYDASKLGSDALATVSMFSTPEFQKASAQSEAYVKAKCGIDVAPNTTTK